MTVNQIVGQSANRFGLSLLSANSCNAHVCFWVCFWSMRGVWRCGAISTCMHMCVYVCVCVCVSVSDIKQTLGQPKTSVDHFVKKKKKTLAMMSVRAPDSPQWTHYCLIYLNDTGTSAVSVPVVAWWHTGHQVVLHEYGRIFSGWLAALVLTFSHFSHLSSGLWVSRQLHG